MKRELLEIRKRIGTEAIAAHFGVPAPTVRRWFSQGFPKARQAKLDAFTARQATIPKPIKAKQRKQLAKRRVKIRSVAAQKGFATRLQNQHGISREAAELWTETPRKQTDQLLNVRVALLGSMALPDSGDMLQELAARKDKRMLKFLEFAEHLGFTSRQARTAFFSPVARKASK